MHSAFFPVHSIDELATAERDDVLHAAALAVSRAVSMPTMEMDTPAAYYEQNIQALAGKILGHFNEIRVFNFAQAQALVKELWLARYAMIHGLPEGHVVPNAFPDQCSVLSLFGAHAYLSENTHKVLRERLQEINVLLYTCEVAARRIRDYYVKSQDGGDPATV